MQIKQGLDYFRQLQEQESASRMGGDFIKHLRLGDDGDQARIRIVSSHDPDLVRDTGIPSHLFAGMFHGVQRTSPSGKTYWNNLLCQRRQVEDGVWEGRCEYCDADNAPRTKCMLWVWVYGIYHRRQNSDLATPWEQVMQGHLTLYREKVEQFWIWLAGYYDMQKLEGRAARNGTLTDRDYDWERHGVRGSQQVTYELIPGDVSPIAASIVERAQSLPDLAKVATGEVRTMDGRAGPAEGAPTATQTRPAEVSVPQDDLDDLPF